MRTIKRNLADVQTTKVYNYNKYLNQMEFTGIKEDENVYTLDQKSFSSSDNVFVDSSNRLVSRPTLQVENLPIDVIPSSYSLVDIYDFSVGKLYISKSSLSNTLTIVAHLNSNITLNSGATLVLEGLTDYHISVIEHYVICFNNINAKLLDTNELEKGWQVFTDKAEIPTTKRVVGDTIKTYDKNNFIPNLYKEEYIWTQKTQPILPDGNTEVVLNDNLGSFELGSLANTDKLTDYRVIIPVNYTGGNQNSIEYELMSVAKNVVCLPTSTYFMCSLDYGKTFIKTYYPAYTGEFMNIASVSKDGQYFFFVARDGVYRCNLSDFTWSNVFKDADGNIKGYRGMISNCYSYFLTGDTFAFMTFQANTNQTLLYFKGTGLYSGSDYTDDHMDPANDNYYTLNRISSIQLPQVTELSSIIGGISQVAYKDNLMLMSIITDNHKKQITTITIANPQFGSYGGTRVIFIYGGDASIAGGTTTMYSTYSSIISSGIAITGLQLLSAEYDINTVTATISCLTTKSNMTDMFIANLTIGQINNVATYNYQDLDELEDCYSPYPDMWRRIGNRTYVFKYANALSFYDSDGHSIYSSVNIKVSNLHIDNDIYYAITYNENALHGYRIWTNNLGSDDSISLTYTRGSAEAFTKVPQASYSDTELYLAFDNLLQITTNKTDGVDIKFNLPDINNQSFIDTISSIINISTTSVALFFLNKVVICSKVSDENWNYRYDYYNTKLSTGTRAGDSTINTLEGSYTIFPTLKGLAAMNYQAFMATTDQVVNYLTDTIKDLWTKFYKDSIIYNNTNNISQIKIIQWQDWLVITNNTNTMLLYDINNAAWWKWTLPVRVLNTFSDQIDLRVIHDKVLLFKYSNQYYDFSETGNFVDINWQIQSQPLHLNAPNYYKNLKQLVFQFADTEDTTSTKTLLAQVKLYRKKITIREPETIQFKIEDLRTFVKRFNYWKINEVQWGLKNDTDTNMPKPFELNGISIKYELGEEVR